MIHSLKSYASISDAILFVDKTVLLFFCVIWKVFGIRRDFGALNIYHVYVLNDNLGLAGLVLRNSGF